jgi:hypothetical protein
VIVVRAGASVGGVTQAEPSTAAVERPGRRSGATVLRIATVALGACLPAGCVGGLLYGFTLLTGDARGLHEWPLAFLGYAVAALVGAAVLVLVEEIALHTDWPGLMVVGSVVGLAAPVLGVIGGFAGEGDQPAFVAVTTLVAAPLALLGLCRVGALPGCGEAPLLLRWQVVLFVVVAAAEASLMAGPLSQPLGIARDEGTAELLVPLLVVGATIVAASPCLAVGDLLARRWGLDPRPRPAGGALARGLGCLVHALLLLAGVAVLVATRGLQVAIDVWRPRVTLTSPEDGASAEGDVVLVRGRVDDANPVRLELVRVPSSIRLPLTVRADGTFEVEVPVEPGYNRLEVQATDPAGNLGRDDVRVSGSYR